MNDAEGHNGRCAEIYCIFVVYMAFRRDTTAIHEIPLVNGNYG